MLKLASPLKNVRQWGQNTCGAVQSLVSDLPPKKSRGVFIPNLFRICSLTGPIWWRQKQPITVQIMSAAVALPFMPDLSLYPGLRVPLCRLLLRSVPASLPGAGCPRCRLILPYLHYISPYLNETCGETSGDTEAHWTHTVQTKAEQDLRFPQQVIVIDKWREVKFHRGPGAIVDEAKVLTFRVRICRHGLEPSVLYKCAWILQG